MRIAFIGILTAIATVYLESVYQTSSVTVAASVGFVCFALMSVAMGLSARSETASAFNRDIFHDKKQLFLYGLALLVTFLATELGFMQRIMGLTGLTVDQWLICIGFALALLLVDEVIKIFLRRRRGHSAATTPASGTGPVAATPSK